MLTRYINHSAFYPADLAVLQRVFDEVCVDGCHETESIDAQSIAAALLTLYQNGMKDEAFLLAEMRARQQDFIKRTG